MSYASRELSTNLGQPIYLVDFEQGGTHYRFTNYDKDYTHATNIYTKSSFTLTNIKQDDDPFKSEFTFTFGIGNSFAFNQLFNKYDSQVFVTVYRGHINEVTPEFVVIKQGRIIGRELTGLGISLVFESDFSKLRDVGLPDKYEYGCRHKLYKFGCGLNKEDYRTNALITAVSGLVITSTAFSSQANGYFNAGYVEFNGAKRFIQNHVGNQITLMTEFNEVILNQTVAVYAGCDRTLATCASKFNNSINHGGAPYMPKKNPFNRSLL